ncbi:hypothetical protein trd_A0727 (plasmid) [Thermomicrobium roseum DSM 5159]|uniref:Uncharacterized protein n=1 Tax=Thermomicrobium roseum (strain ATCC 27502 / DSM 5159 / P-2) TaxID=309801 RepID=B9L4L3_THERP|nr:hypothetical protein trd_A0727 [Thermomicrobium roseum DSM 5159]
MSSVAVGVVRVVKSLPMLLWRAASRPISGGAAAVLIVLAFVLGSTLPVLATRWVGEGHRMPAPPPQWAIDPARPKEGCIYFPETQHNLCGGFRQYWEQYGGLLMFGYPLTEEYSAPELGENGVVTQWFERARFEWHPGKIPARNDVLQGHLGREIMAILTENRREGHPPSGWSPPSSGATATPWPTPTPVPTPTPTPTPTAAPITTLPMPTPTVTPALPPIVELPTPTPTATAGLPSMPQQADPVTTHPDIARAWADIAQELQISPSFWSTYYRNTPPEVMAEIQLYCRYYPVCIDMVNYQWWLGYVNLHLPMPRDFNPTVLPPRFLYAGYGTCPGPWRYSALWYIVRTTNTRCTFAWTWSPGLLSPSLPTGDPNDLSYWYDWFPSLTMSEVQPVVRQYQGNPYLIAKELYRLRWMKARPSS